MKQWGTVTLANQGRNALSILQYYYGNNIEIVRTNNIQAIPESYPGTPLRLGSTGNAVRTIQRLSLIHICTCARKLCLWFSHDPAP